MQKTFEELEELVKNISPDKVKEVAHFMENKLARLKNCYEESHKQSGDYFQNKLMDKLHYEPLKKYIRGEEGAKNVAYGKKAIQLHLKNGLPKTNIQQPIELYSFYFGAYKELFNVFPVKFLRKMLDDDKTFLKEILSSRKEDLEEPVEFQHNEAPPKQLNIIPFIEVGESVLRIDILEDIFNLLGKSRKVNITGISGIGKTFLAKHFSQHYEGQFTNMVWLNCAEGFPKAFSQEKGIGLLGSLGLAKEYDSYLGNEKGLMNLVIGNLAKIEGNNLLVLDNLEDSISSYKDELALLSKNWNILGTSQQQLKGFENYSTPDFKKESLGLFYTFYTVEKDDDNVIRLLSAIEYHTLAIELLAKTADERGLSIIALFNRFTKKGINVVEQIEIESEHGIERKKITIENIEEYLNIIFDTSSLKEEQCKILLNIALMQEDSIPMVLFEEVYLNNTSEEDIVDVFNYNLKTLVKKGWVKVENERIRLHGLVKSIILKRFLHRNEFFDSTIIYLGKAIEISHTKNILGKIEYLIMIESLLENYVETDKGIMHLKNKTSLIYLRMGLFEKAKEIEINNLHLRQKTENINGMMSCLSNLSMIFKAQGKIEEALLYSNQLYSLFDSEAKEKMYSSLINHLTSFLKNNKIENLTDFYSNVDLKTNINRVELLLLAYSQIIIYQDKNNDLSKKIKDLKKIVLRRQSILNIFEKYIPETLIMSIEIYEKILINNITLFGYIGRCYLKLKQYSEAEKYLRRVLWAQEKILDKGHYSFSNSYHWLTLLYLERENIEQAEYFLEKNREICATLSSNHPSNMSFLKDIVFIEELKHKKNASENLEKIIQSRFNILNEENQNPEYYNELSSIYFEYENYEKSNEYIIKGIDVLLYTDNVDYSMLISLYIRSGLCYLELDDLDNALQLYNKAIILQNENNINDNGVSKEVSDFTDLLTQVAFQKKFIPIIIPLIKKELEFLENKYKTIISELSSKNSLSTIIEKIFIFLSSTSHLKKTIEEIKTTEEKKDLFLTSYDALIVNLIKECQDSQSIDIYETKICYKILDEYYQTIANLFMKHERHKIVIQFYDKRLHINQKYFEKSENVGIIYQNISRSHFKLEQFELSQESIRNAINSYSKFLENQNDDTETVELVKIQLKDALNLEKKIKEELKNYRK